MTINLRKIALFILIAFGLSWSVALAMVALGVSLGSIPSIVIIALLYMPAPAIAAWIVQRRVYGERLAPLGLTLRGVSIRFLLLTILMVWALAIGTLLVVAIAHAAGLADFGRVATSSDDVAAQITSLAKKMNAPASEQNMPKIHPALLFVLMLVGGTLSGSVLNLPFAFGEELGWRGLLLRETQTLGFFPSNLLIGIVWGVWHAPIIVQGHNYPDHPVTGVLMMVAFTTVMSFPLAYSRFKTRSILGPSVFHAALNAVGAIPLIFVVAPNPLFGSTPGVAGIIVGTVISIAIVVLDRQFVRDYRQLER